MEKPVTELFGLRLANSLKNAEDEPIKFTYKADRTDYTKEFVPELNKSYVFSNDELISVGIALEENIPLLIWGPHGTGKTTLPEQFCARTNRPSIRLQHTVDMEASDVIGQWILKGGSTEFAYGPLARAMRDGLVYIADEYDFALPNVLAVYQAVLEGEPLFIKNAPEHMAVVKPHPDFRFVATGNTNGSGDESGLYQGTQIQNAANYSRFGMTIKLGFSSSEKNIIKNILGPIPDVDLKMLFDFVKQVREAFDNRTITNNISTRELIEVARLAVLRGRDKLNFRYGIKHGFANRMSSIDEAAIMAIVSRVFD